MYSLAICDDDIGTLRSLGELLLESYRDRVLLRVYSSGGVLRDALKRGVIPDVAIIDVEMGACDGIGLASELFPVNSSTKVIFMSGDSRCCMRAYETEHVYFLLKPVVREQLKAAVDKAFRELETAERECIALESTGGARVLPYRKIRYIEKHGRRLRFVTDDGVYEDIRSTAFSVDSLPSGFIVCRKGYVVNLARAASVQRSGFTLITGETVPVSRSRFNDVRGAFLDYRGK